MVKKKITVETNNEVLNTKFSEEQIANLVHVLITYYDNLNKEIGQTIFKKNCNITLLNYINSNYEEEDIYVMLIEFLSTIDNIGFSILLKQLKARLPEKYIQLLIDIKTNYVVF